ncbi:MAG: hypothetical protein IIA27_09095 [Gemmatimonadetes bacterium]|nr:hypothetical protein [Gemmatimonadota bacterium]
MDTLAILSPGYPDDLGGVTHHTARLMANWTAAGHRVDVIGDTTVGAEVAVDRLRRGGTDCILLQYVPFLYGRRGVSSYPERFARACAARGMRLTIFVHEPWVPPTRIPWIPLGWLQRRQLRRLLRMAPKAVTTVPTWQEMLGAHVRLIYVGCTLGPPGRGSSTPAPSLGAPVVFSPFAAGLRWDWIAEACRSLDTDPPLIVIGADADTVRAHPTVGKWFREQWDYRGRLPAPDIMRLLSAAKLVLSPFIDGMTGRRTSAFAALSAGARVLTSSGHLFDPFFMKSPFHIAATMEDFVQTAATLWATADSDSERQRRIEWHQTHVDPALLDARLLAMVLE